jgi:hypothetical protein
MKLIGTAAVTALLAFAATPALAANEHANGHANGGNGNSGQEHGSSAEAPKGNAYGRACQDLSKKHVEGESGTPFSQCVKAMAQVDAGEAKSARKACKGLSKKHVKGEKGTPFSQCVKAARNLDGDVEEPAEEPAA